MSVAAGYKGSITCYSCWPLLLRQQQLAWLLVRAHQQDQAAAVMCCSCYLLLIGAAVCLLWVCLNLQLLQVADSACRTSTAVVAEPAGCVGFRFGYSLVWHFVGSSQEPVPELPTATADSWCQQSKHVQQVAAVGGIKPGCACKGATKDLV